MADPVAERLVIVGFGMAAARLVEELTRTGDTGCGYEITVVGEEPYPAYNRVLLSDAVAGRADLGGLALVQPDSLERNGIRVLTGRRTVELDRRHRQVTLDDGHRLPYDRLVLATGAEPVLPALPGLLARAPEPAEPTASLARGAHALRTVDDAREIVAAAANAQAAVVIGAGAIGLEVARGLAGRGLAVTVVGRGGRLLAEHLGVEAGAVLDAGLHRLGVRIARATARAVEVDSGGAVTGVRLDDGSVITASLLVVACGARPRTELARAAGLAVGSHGDSGVGSGGRSSGGSGGGAGVAVGTDLATTDPRVHALGDCAQVAGVTSGLIQPAWEQAIELARALRAGDRAHWAPSAPVLRLKTADLSVTAAGETRLDEACDDVVQGRAHVVSLRSTAAGVYLRAVVRDGVVTGAVAIGDARAGAELAAMVERGSPAPADPAALVMAGRWRSVAAVAAEVDPALLPARSTICRCNGVTKGRIVQAWNGGARGLEAVTAVTRATTGCGGCTTSVDGLLQWLHTVDPIDCRPGVDPDDCRPGVDPDDAHSLTLAGGQ